MTSKDRLVRNAGDPKTLNYLRMERGFSWGGGKSIIMENKNGLEKSHFKH